MKDIDRDCRFLLEVNWRQSRLHLLDSGVSFSKFCTLPQMFLFRRMLIKVVDGLAPCVDKIKQSKWYINNSAVMFWQVTGETQLIYSLKMAIWKEHHIYVAVG